MDKIKIRVNTEIALTPEQIEQIFDDEFSDIGDTGRVVISVHTKFTGFSIVPKLIAMTQHSDTWRQINISEKRFFDIFEIE